MTNNTFPFHSPFSFSGDRRATAGKRIACWLLLLCLASTSMVAADHPPIEIIQPDTNLDLSVGGAFTARQTIILPSDAIFLNSVRIGTGPTLVGEVELDFFDSVANAVVGTVTSSFLDFDEMIFFHFNPLVAVTPNQNYELRMRRPSATDPPWNIQLNDTSVLTPPSGPNYADGIFIHPVFGPATTQDARFQVLFARREQPIHLELSDVDVGLKKSDTTDNDVDVLGVTDPFIGAPLLNRPDTSVLLDEQSTYFLYSEPFTGGGTLMDLAVHFPDGGIRSARFEIGPLTLAVPWQRVSGDPDLVLSSTGILDQDRIGFGEDLGPNGVFDVVLQLSIVPEPSTAALCIGALLTLGAWRRTQRA